VVSFPSVVFSVVIDRFNDERLQCKEQAPCAAYLSLKNRELQSLYQCCTLPLKGLPSDVVMEVACALHNLRVSHGTRCLRSIC
jgi:hypothetical protein